MSKSQVTPPSDDWGGAPTPSISPVSAIVFSTVTGRLGITPTLNASPAIEDFPLWIEIDCSEEATCPRDAAGIFNV